MGNIRRKLFAASWHHTLSCDLQLGRRIQYVEFPELHHYKVLQLHGDITRQAQTVLCLLPYFI